jgi:hypothetical protein
MTNSRFLILCTLVLGGTVTDAYFGSQGLPVVHAQVVGPSSVRGTAFTLVDGQNNVQGTLRSSASGASLVLNDVAGRSRVEIGVSGGIVIREANGRVTWRSPRSGVMPATE